MSERFKLVYNKDELGYMIIDTEDDLRDEIHAWNLLCDLLNEQDDEIKRLKLYKESLQDKFLDSEAKTHDCLLKARDELDKIFSENKTLKYMNDCLQKQLDCTNKNYNELSKRYYNLQQSNKLRQDEPLPDSSLEKRLVDCEEYLKKMQSERDIYKNKYEKLSKKSKELFLHLKNTVVWYLGKAFANTNINEIYYNKILNCLDDIETKLIGVVNNEKV